MSLLFVVSGFACTHRRKKQLHSAAITAYIIVIIYSPQIEVFIHKLHTFFFSQFQWNQKPWIHNVTMSTTIDDDDDLQRTHTRSMMEYDVIFNLKWKFKLIEMMHDAIVNQYFIVAAIIIMVFVSFFCYFATASSSSSSFVIFFLCALNLFQNHIDCKRETWNWINIKATASWSEKNNDQHISHRNWKLFWWFNLALDDHQIESVTSWHTIFAISSSFIWFVRCLQIHSHETEYTHF